MRTVVLAFHPDLAGGSRVNARLASAAREAGVEVRDEYALHPGFRIDVALEAQASAYGEALTAPRASFGLFEV